MGGPGRRIFHFVVSSTVLLALSLLPGTAGAIQSAATPVSGSTETLAETTVGALPPPPSVIALVRITLAPAVELTDLSVAGPELIAVESGTLSVSMPGELEEEEEVLERVHRGGSPVPEELATPVPGRFVFVLAPGDNLFVPGDTPHTIRNAAQEPSVFLATAVTPQPANDMATTWPPEAFDQLPAGAEIEALDVGYSASTSTSEPATIRLVRLSDLSGEVMPRHQAGGPELIVVEDGVLEVGVESGTVEIRDANFDRSETIQVEESGATPTALQTISGGAILLQPGTIATVRSGAGDPVTVLLLTVLDA